MEEYTNKELYLLLSSHIDKFDLFVEQNNKDHEEVKCKQDKTNGNVRRLQLWRAGLASAITVILFILSSGIPIFVKYVEKQVHITSADVIALINQNNERLGLYKK
jgi:hypothetical protein